MKIRHTSGFEVQLSLIPKKKKKILKTKLTCSVRYLLPAVFGGVARQVKHLSGSVYLFSWLCVRVCHHLRAPLKASAWRGCLKVCSHPRWMVTMTTLSDTRLFSLPLSTAIWALLSSDTLRQPMFKSSPSLSVPAAATLTLVFLSGSCKSPPNPDHSL